MGKQHVEVASVKSMLRIVASSSCDVGVYVAPEEVFATWDTDSFVPEDRLRVLRVTK